MTNIMTNYTTNTTDTSFSTNSTITINTTNTINSTNLTNTANTTNIKTNTRNTMTNTFLSLDLIPELIKNLTHEGYQNPTPIQAAAIPVILSQKDLLGIAQTGTGKTAAFALPLLQLLAQSKKPLTPKNPRVLVLVPTRELAVQVYKSFEAYGKSLSLKFAVIYGGVGQSQQVQSIARGVDVLVATPGRLLDLINQKYLQIGKVEMFVLDEADRMLDMGFIRDIRQVLPLLPSHRQNLFFSATMPKEVRSLSESILNNPEKITVTPPSTTVERIEQKVMFVHREKKMDLLLELLKNNNLYKVLVFVDMKHMANKVTDKLVKHKIQSAAIHGNKSQGARQKAIEDFKQDRIRVLVATDIAARGIDIDGITHVINYDLPHIVENYVHRIGRTARAGTSGEAISFCTGFEKSYLYSIEKVTRAKINIDSQHPFHSTDAEQAKVFSAGKAKAMIESNKKVNPRRFQNKRGSFNKSKSKSSNHKFI